MTKPVKVVLVFVLATVLAALTFYGVRLGKTPEEKAAETPTGSAEAALQTAIRLSMDAETALKNGAVRHIRLADGGSTADTPGVRVQGNTVTIAASGIYSVSGSLSEGQLTVDCEGPVTLVMEGAEITNPVAAAISILNAEHTLIYLPENSVNRLVSGTEREIAAGDDNTETESASGAALYARDDLSIAGSGKMTVGGYVNNAVATTDHLTVLGGEMEITAVNNGLKGKDAVTVLGGNVRILSGKDGIRSGNGAGDGAIDIRGGEISVISFGDGMDAEGDLSVTDGTIDIRAGDTTSVRPAESMRPMEKPPENGQNGMNDEKMGFPGRPGSEMPPPEGEEPPEMPDFGATGRLNGEIPPEWSGGEDAGAPRNGMRDRGGMRGGRPDMFGREQSGTSDNGASTKGLKSGGDLTVSGGHITVDSEDDCIHANGSLTITGGTFLLSAGDDGLHADDRLTVSAGNVTVSRSYEGIEAHSICISGGTISVTASDDGLNAAGNGDEPFGGMLGDWKGGDGSLPLLEISGGTLYVNASGDGLDSNGDLIVEGGNIIVDGPVNDGNGALDGGTESGGRILCNGGTVLAIGASGMAETFSGDSVQCSFIKNYSETMQAGTRITIADENGETIFAYDSAKTFSSVVFSSPELVLGNTYILSVGGQTDTITMESVSNGASSGFGMPGGFGRFPGNGTRKPPELEGKTEMPEPNQRDHVQ